MCVCVRARRMRLRSGSEFALDTTLDPATPLECRLSEVISSINVIKCYGWEDSRGALTGPHNKQ